MMTAFQKWFVWGSSFLTAVTGIVYWWMQHMMEPVSEWAVINHPLQPWVLKAHIVVAPAMVLAVGTILLEHIWKHYRGRVRRARRSGLATMWVLAPMILSGYLIQAVTSSGWLTALVWVHVGTGVVYSVGLLAHKWALQRRGAAPNGGTVGPARARGDRRAETLSG
jgi:hypothetical protein